MNRHCLHRRCSPLSLVAVLSLGGLALSLNAASTNTPPWELPVPKSVFVDDNKAGRDPFFPRSSRRAPKSPNPPTKGDPTKGPLEKSPSDRLRLQGITGKVALINNVDFVAGQESEVRTSGGKLKIRCVAIRQNSVVIQASGEPEPKILKLAD